MSVYFVGSFDNNNTLTALKIGESDRPRDRLQQLQTGNPNRLEILKILPGNSQDEKRWHHQWAHLRGKGEWFTPSPELLDFINDSCANQAIDIDLHTNQAGQAVEDDWDLSEYIYPDPPVGADTPDPCLIWLLCGIGLAFIL
jgi:hypothetical protein